MALSMDEQRMLAEIEKRLAAEDPGLATRMSSFRRPVPATGFRTTRGRIVGTVCTVVLLAAIAVAVYAMMPFRAGTSKTQLSRQSPPRTTVSAPARTASGSATQSATSGSTAPDSSVRPVSGGVAG
jgi:cytoskeletal protein RodZ